MYIKNQLKKRFYISLVTVIALVLTIVGSSYALFMDVESNTVDQVLTVGDLQITYNGGSAISVENIKPMTDTKALEQTDNIYTFTIENIGNLAYHYTIYLEDNPGYAGSNLLNHSYIRYKLDSEESATLGDATDGIIFEGILNPGQAKLYTLRIWVGDATLYNLPNEALGSEIHLNISVDGKAGREGKYCDTANMNLLADNILCSGTTPEAIEAKGNPNFAAIATSADTGLYAAEDEYGTSYYYRGLKTELNNNLIFAGFQWKIVRINGDGSIRIIYNGVCPGNECAINNQHANTEAGSTSILRTGTTYIHIWNANYNDNKYVGYMYGGANGSASTSRETGMLSGGYNQSTNAVYNETSSNAKVQLESWYASKIIPQGPNITSKIVDNVFCNDRRLQSEVGGTSTGTGIGNSETYYAASYRLSTNKTPTLKCGFQNDRYTVSEITKGNGALEYPVGLVSADEASMAGLVYSVNNSTNYLYTNQSYWTFSPRNFGGGGACVWYVNSDGRLYDLYAISSSLGLRPIISLDSGTTILGEGSTSNPYKVV